jgi:hypothetical protein
MFPYNSRYFVGKNEAEPLEENKKDDGKGQNKNYQLQKGIEKFHCAHL